jgi:pyruvate-formate lyase-activating enzyme
MALFDPTLFDRIFPFRGTWDFPWIVQRYLRSSISGFNTGKFRNAARAYLEMRSGRTQVNSKPAVLRIEPCNVCTLQCPNCACGAKVDRRQKGFLSIEDLKFVLEQTEDSVVVVRLDGMGEPTMHPHIFDMVRSIKSRKMSVTMSTNMQPPNCDKTEDFIRSGLDRLVVAVDGATQEIYGQYRIGGDLQTVAERVVELIKLKRSLKAKYPLVEIQFLDLEHNRFQLGEVRALARRWGVDKFTVTGADPTSKAARKALPANPKRCFWLWFVVTVGWNLDYRSCTNAWSLAWPDMNMRDVIVREYWNHPQLREARKFNITRTSDFISGHSGCKCNRCFEMLVVPMEGDYFCE